MKTIAVYAGSFDPITYGHMNIVHKAIDAFDMVYVAVGNNPHKKHLFTIEERIDMISNSFKEQLINKAKVTYFSGSLSRFCIDNRCTHIVRGLRNVTDFEYELQMAAINKQYCQDVETVFFVPDSDYSFVSSSMVKELYLSGESISNYAGEYVENCLREKYQSLKLV